MKGRERTVKEARAAVKAEPERWKVALVYGDTAPLTEAATVRLYTTVKGAEEDLREMWKRDQADGWKRSFGGLGSGHIKAIRGDEVRVIFLQKKP